MGHYFSRQDEFAMNTYKKIAILCLMVLSGLQGCKKDSATADDSAKLKVYSLEGIGNAAVKDAKCGIDLANGRLYSVVAGQQHQNEIDIAYGYMTTGDPSYYARCFLNLSYAGCFCGGSSYFSYGDQPNRQGYSSYSVLNATRIEAGSEQINFDQLAARGTKAALDEVFAAQPNSNGSVDEVTFADGADNLVVSHILFTTVKGKRGVIRIKPYVKNRQQNYHLQANEISIDVVVEP